jgi:hypothetical protein
VNQHARIACCPSCGRPLPALPRVKQRIFDLVGRYPGIAAERLRELVWADDPNGGPENRKLIRVHVHQLNRMLAPFGVRVRGSISYGYRIQFHPESGS